MLVILSDAVDGSRQLPEVHDPTGPVIGAGVLAKGHDKGAILMRMVS